MSKVTAWALIDPNWGEPKPVISTIRATEAEAVAAAIIAEEVSLYSGAALHCVPIRPGTMAGLERHGYRVARAAITAGGRDDRR